MAKEVPNADKLIVTIGKVNAAAGTYPIAYADGHGATFQVGVYDASGPPPTTTPAKAGSLRLDTWSDVAGSKVTGHLDLSNDESNVTGTFTADVCAAR